MPLTDTEYKNAKPGNKAVRLFDGGGLYIEIAPRGSKLWRFKYRFAGKEKCLAFGTYPLMPLASRKAPETGKRIRGARELRDEAKALLADGLDPGNPIRHELPSSMMRRSYKTSGSIGTTIRSRTPSLIVIAWIRSPSGLSSWRSMGLPSRSRTCSRSTASWRKGEA